MTGSVGSKQRCAPGVLQTGNTVILVAIFLSVAPLPIDSTAVLTVGLVALVFYAVEALGAVYDLGSVIAQEVRA